MGLLQSIWCLQAKNREFNDWEQSMAVQRSKGLFFKSLHRLKNQQGASISRDAQKVSWLWQTRLQLSWSPLLPAVFTNFPHHQYE